MKAATPFQSCDECEHFAYDHHNASEHCERCEECCEFTLPAQHNRSSQ